MRDGWLRRHRGLAAVVLALVLLLVAFGGWYYSLNKALGRIPTFSVDLVEPDRPPALRGKGRTLLLAGVDGDAGGPRLGEALASGTWQPGLFRSDTIMVVHLEADGEAGQVISIPRDSYVSIPGYPRQKINAALSYGGPSLLVQTVEALTGLRIEHTVVVDFRGFEEITETLGGASVTLPVDTFDPVTGTTLKAGNHVLSGKQALAYVRERKLLARGDFDRVQRQQNLVRALALRLVSKGTLANPVRMVALAEDLGDAIAVDSGLTPSRMLALARSARGLEVERMRFVTIPYRGTGTIDGASVVLLDEGRAAAMFRALADGNFESWYAGESIDELPEKEQVP